MDIEPGTVVANRYRISRAIGRGGMGEVFAAENIRTGRPVAVKLLRADSKSKSSAVERFRREARAAGSINSDHVTQVLDVEDDAEHGIVIVFELLEGESLIDRLKRTGPIPFDELHPIIEEVWVGLSDAHKVGIIHRDLKPSNVFLERRPDGHQRVKILDFGISKLPKEMGGETLTEMGQSLGTFSFMPPEQIGRAKTVDHRADIYATTTMIYQSLTGQLPYVARNILVMVEMKSKTNPRPLSEALGHPVDPALEQFVAKGLARNPADRFQNALDALEKWRALKALHVPESRRPISVPDLNAQARLAASGQGPAPAGGRARTGTYPPPGRSPSGQFAPPSAVPSSGVAASMRDAQSYQRPQSGAFAPASSGPVPSSGMAPPAPVVPAGMLDLKMPAALPRLDDPTESTTDVSHIELVNPKQPASESSGIAQRGQELRPANAEPAERQGPQGTRVLPPSVRKQALSLAEARKASQAQAANAAQAPQPQGQAPQPQAQPQPSQGQPAHAQAQAQPQRRPTPQPMAAVSPQAQPAGAQPSRQTGAPRYPESAAGGAPQQAQPHPSSYPPPGTGAPPPPASSISGPPPVSGAHPVSHAAPSHAAPSHAAPSSHVASSHPASSHAAPSHPAQSASGHGAAPPGPASAVQSVPGSDPRVSSQPPQSPHLAQAPTPFPGTPQSQSGGSFPGAAQAQAQSQQGAAPASAQPMGLPPLRPGAPVQLSTMRLPDEPSSIPTSQDKTTVYRPKQQRKPEKKQSTAVFVLGALAFAIVGFGIVFIVQYLVHRFSPPH